MNGKKRYEGELKDGKFHGKGILYDADGSKIYEGEWKDGTNATSWGREESVRA